VITVNDGLTASTPDTTSHRAVTGGVVDGEGVRTGATEAADEGEDATEDVVLDVHAASNAIVPASASAPIARIVRTVIGDVLSASGHDTPRGNRCVKAKGLLRVNLATRRGT
jgi:hypothetical protein